VSNATARLVKAVVGLVIVLVLLIMVSNWWGDYKSAASQLPSKPSTGTVDASGTAGSKDGTATGSAKTGVVLIEGLNFRAKPDATMDSIRGLKKGEKVTIIAIKGDWYQVKDSKGVDGWIAAKSQYVRIEK
jgi:uncharacterized protein YgiM (DUF1202 family)